MSEILQACINHPERLTKRKCLICEKAVCRECRWKFRNHTFCSFNCIVKFSKAKIPNIKFDYLKQYPIIFLKTFLAKPPRFFDILLTFAVILNFIILISVNNKSKSNLNENVKIVLGEPKINFPNDGARIYIDNFGIKGESQDGEFAVLLINGELVRTEMVKDSKFDFENVELKLGKNKIGVKIFRKDGATSSLKEISVNYEPLNSKPRVKIRDIKRGDILKKMIALTFDGGAEDNAVTEILDILKKENIKCTMFLTGGFINKYPDEVNQMLEDGHEIGNHTFSHPHLTSYEKNRRHDTLENVDREFLQEQLKKTEELFEEVTGKKIEKIWRAPFGEYNEEILSWAGELGYKHIGWTSEPDGNMDTMDWVADKSDKKYKTSEEIKNKILSFGENRKYGKNGAIVLMHLGTKRKDDHLHKQLPAIVEGLKNEGYSIVKVTEMLEINEE